MADIKKFAPILIKKEGGYVNHPNDKGGATKYGITLATAKRFGFDKNNDGVINAEDVKLLDEQDFIKVLRSFWDTCKADEINNQSIANFIVDFYYNSGTSALRVMQRALGVNPDGIFGQKTINAINYPCPHINFRNLKHARLTFVHNIVINKPNQEVFLKGWLNRINSFEYSEN